MCCKSKKASGLFATDSDIKQLMSTLLYDEAVVGIYQCKCVENMWLAGTEYVLFALKKKSGHGMVG